VSYAGPVALHLGAILRWTGPFPPLLELDSMRNRCRPPALARRGSLVRDDAVRLVCLSGAKRRTSK